MRKCPNVTALLHIHMVSCLHIIHFLVNKATVHEKAPNPNTQALGHETLLAGNLLMPGTCLLLSKPTESMREEKQPLWMLLTLGQLATL